MMHALPTTNEELTSDILSLAELYRLEACRRLEGDSRTELGQFLTPPPVARRLASLFRPMPESVVLLDAGAGVGMLTAAAVQQFLGKKKPKSVRLVAYEIEPVFLPLLEDVLRRLCDQARAQGVEATYEIRREDFVSASVTALQGDLFGGPKTAFTHAILNPPFRKLNTDSAERRALNGLGMECTNLYAAFVWLAVRQLVVKGELAAITPRSFCNGPYFQAYREGLLEAVALDRVVLIEERNLAFSSDNVLQETVLFHGVRGGRPVKKVTVQTDYGADLSNSAVQEVPFSDFVSSEDPARMIHLVPDGHQAGIKKQMESLSCSLKDLGLTVSTGRVVDFRAPDYLRDKPGSNTVPLLYPVHLQGGTVRWPVTSKKPNALVDTKETKSLLVPMGHYVLVKRFSSKEEKRRVVATHFTPDLFGGVEEVGFENHLNYFHLDGRPLDPVIAAGLASFLNSSAVDEYFRQFNGHTQVNATDLRRLRYPSLAQLAVLGRQSSTLHDQKILDKAVAAALNFMPESTLALEGTKRIEDALAILKALGVPREQQNERSALVLLAMADIQPKTPWPKAASRRLGITKTMDFIRDIYGKTYAPNTRETIRRFTVHQFVQIGILAQNRDRPDRPVNSPHNVYEIEAPALELMRTFGTAAWAPMLKAYLTGAIKLVALREKERTMSLVPVQMPGGKTVNLSAGGQNDLIKALVEGFCPRFTPGGSVLYLGDAGDKWLINEDKALAALGISPDAHGKMPDLVVHFTAKNWLVLIEAVTSHGPMNLKRKNELKVLFGKAKAGLVFVTAFLTRADMVKFLREISWETEVWVAEEPTHMIHFNGERFLGPYDV